MLTRLALAAIAALSFALPAVSQLPNLPHNLVVPPGVNISLHADPVTGDLRMFLWSLSGPDVMRFEDPNPDATGTRHFADVQLRAEQMFLYDPRPCSNTPMPIVIGYNDSFSQRHESLPNAAGTLQSFGPRFGPSDGPTLRFEYDVQGQGGTYPGVTGSMWWMWVCGGFPGGPCDPHPCASPSGASASISPLWGIDCRVTIR